MTTYEPRDRFYRRARELGLPSRAAFKLEELIERFHLMRGCARVVDLGCAPGGWLAILSRAADCRVVGIDLSPCRAPARTTALTGDIRDPRVWELTLATLGQRADLITCDLSPKLSGVAERDQARAFELLEAAVNFAHAALRPGGAMVAKLFMGADFARERALFESRFSSVEVTRARATRAGSSELYVVARGFRGHVRTCP